MTHPSKPWYVKSYGMITHPTTYMYYKREDPDHICERQLICISLGRSRIFTIAWFPIYAKSHYTRDPN